MAPFPGNEVELLVKIRKELDDKEKSNEKLNKKLKKSEETQAKLESELREFKVRVSILVSSLLYISTLLWPLLRLIVIMALSNRFSVAQSASV